MQPEFFFLTECVIVKALAVIHHKKLFLLDPQFFHDLFQHLYFFRVQVFHGKSQQMDLHLPLISSWKHEHFPEKYRQQIHRPVIHVFDPYQAARLRLFPEILYERPAACVRILAFECLPAKIPLSDPSFFVKRHRDLVLLTARDRT